MTGGRRLTACATGVLLVIVAALVAGQVFAGAAWVLPVLAAAVVPAVCAVGVAALRGPLLGLLSGTGALALLLALGVAPGRALASGGRRLLSGALPLEPTGGELAAVALGTGVFALLAVLVALTARTTLAVAVPGLVALTLALAVSASAGAPPSALVVAAALAVGGLRLAGLGPAGSPVPSSRVARLRAPLAAVVVLALAAAVAPAAGALPGAGLRDGRADARALVQVPVTPRTSTSPLARFAALAGGEPRPVAEVTGGPVDRLRLATLDRFDGEGWTSSATGVRAGRSLPAPPADGLPRTSVSRRVEVVEPALLDFLLTPGRADRVSVPGLGVVPATGDLLVPADRPVPSVYDVTASSPDLSGVSLRQARAARRTPLEAPAPLGEQAGRRASGSTDFARLAALESSLAQGRRAEGAQLPSGSGLFQVQQLLNTRTGTAEQWSSAFAVLARILGFDARVVVGFQPSASPAPDRMRTTVLTTEVTAWPEVRFDELGWLPFAPTPAAGRPPAGSPEEAVRRAVEQEKLAVAAPPGPTPAPSAPGAPAAAAPAPPPAVRPADRPIAGILLGLALVLLLLAAASTPVRKARRRRLRSTRTDPAARALGAWQEAVDRFVEHGLSRTPAATSGELLTGARPLLPHSGHAGLVELARLADRAAWSRTGADASHADRAWLLAHSTASLLRAGTSVPRRLRGALDPRPLRRR